MRELIKHLQGQHDQKRHGGSRTSGTSFASDRSKKAFSSIDRGNYQNSSFDNPPNGWNKSSRGGIISHSGKHGRGASVFPIGNRYAVTVHTGTGSGEPKLKIETSSTSDAIAYADSWVKGSVKF